MWPSDGRELNAAERDRNCTKTSHFKVLGNASCTCTVRSIIHQLYSHLFLAQLFPNGNITFTYITVPSGLATALLPSSVTIGLSDAYAANRSAKPVLDQRMMDSRRKMHVYNNL